MWYSIWCIILIKYLNNRIKSVIWLERLYLIDCEKWEHCAWGLFHPKGDYLRCQNLSAFWKLFQIYEAAMDIVSWLGWSVMLCINTRRELWDDWFLLGSRFYIVSVWCCSSVWSVLVYSRFFNQPWLSCHGVVYVLAFLGYGRCAVRLFSDGLVMGLFLLWICADLHFAACFFSPFAHLVLKVNPINIFWCSK